MSGHGGSMNPTAPIARHGALQCPGRDSERAEGTATGACGVLVLGVRHGGHR